VSSPSGVRGGAPAKNEFGAFCGRYMDVDSNYFCLISVSLNTAVVHSHYCFERCKKYNNVITAKRLSIYGMLVMYASRKPLLHCARSCNQSTLAQRVPELLCRIVGVISKYFGNCHKTLQYSIAVWTRVGHGLGPSMGWVGSVFLIFGGLGWVET